MTLTKKQKAFNDFRFEGLNWSNYTNKYITMNRVSEDENKIVVKVADDHILETKFGYALILDISHVVFLKEWQVSSNFYGTEVLLTREFFKVKEWGSHPAFAENPENYEFDTFLQAAKGQDSLVDEFGSKVNFVRWEK